MEFVRNNPQKTASLLSAAYRIPEADLLKYLQAPGTEYRLEIKGIKEFAAFMKRNGYIDKTPSQRLEILWEDANYDE
jgi:NitT/TauT family transport system substrate-binding protein